jgi:hypothetical protein
VTDSLHAHLPPLNFPNRLLKFLAADVPALCEEVGAMKRRQQWQQAMWAWWGLLSVWIIGFSFIEPLPARTTCVLGLAILSFVAIAWIAPEVRPHRITPIVGLALAGAVPVLDVSCTGAVATSALIVASVVVGLTIWAVIMDRAFFLRVRYWPRR